MVEQLARIKRKRKIQARIRGTEEKPRLAVYRSLRNLEAQLINDTKGITILGMKASKNKVEEMAKNFTAAAKKKKIKKVVFDRGGFAYQGVIKKFAQKLRQEGMEF